VVEDEEAVVGSLHGCLLVWEEVGDVLTRAALE
jgi:hypothetical protein